MGTNGRMTRQVRLRRSGITVAAVLALVTGLAMNVSSASAVSLASIGALESAAPPLKRNVVQHPEPLTDMQGWSAASDAGPTSLRSVALPAGSPAATAVEVARPAGTGEWGMALASLHDPAASFEVGRTYRMQMWVRDLRASGEDVGLLLANGNYDHRPVDASVWGGYRDSAWHLLARTFVARAPAAGDTSLYVALPSSGALRWQFAGAQVGEVDAPEPATVTGPATRTIDFPGAAGAAPDARIWNHEVGGSGWGNGELQTYTSSTRNASVDGAGRLRITARRETLTGSDEITRNYTSARLTTENKVVIAPGSYVEASIKAPTGAGVWPAFWLIGANHGTVGWPASGELDVLEGHGASPTDTFRAVHASSLSLPEQDNPFGWGDDGGRVDLGQPLDATFHTYGVYFDKDLVRFYVDRREVMSLWAADGAANDRAWPFGKPQYPILNVAVSDDPSATVFPRTMLVDNISIWSGGVPAAGTAASG